MARKVNITLPKVSDLVLQVKLEGEWQRVEALVSNLGPSMQRDMIKPWVYSLETSLQS